MEAAEIYKKLDSIFQDVFDNPAIAVAPGLEASQVDGWDSLSHIRLMLTIERAFGVRFSAAEIGNLKNVGELVSLLRSKV